MKTISIIILLIGISIGSYFWVERGEYSDINPHKKMSCYKFERKAGGFRYTKDEYHDQKTKWKLFEPKHPGMINMYFARKAFKQALQKVKEKIGVSKNDKFLHCYVGSEIAKSSNYQTVNYLAWLKEWRDLKDCKRISTFEIQDYDATVLGATLIEKDKDVDTWEESIKRFGHP